MALTKGCFNIKAVKPIPAQPADALANIETNPLYEVVFDGALKREDKIERLTLLFTNAAAAPGSRFEKCVDDLKTMHRYLLQEHASTSMEIFKLTLSAEGAEKDKLNATMSDLNKSVYSAYGIIHAAFNAAGNAHLSKQGVVADVTASYEKFNRICGHEPVAPVPERLPVPAAAPELRRAPQQFRKLG
ncbi:MAG: hypothetical protein ACAH80_13325 [Alphaproteobacteria bacterium]